ncbi:hypothetical protein SHELI_v1c04900 [Spiroplasma helicoides]|uniref:Lipoprotein n=1 Tax=Spiroplasma helicoides TaxID=216938 RepID=A0A1B3SKH6_9MOLU|nr:hypothetical protein [Spiroplasma helicoides]AOG60441.1 hypothetical protein SHELI_v1c04900 [Spiroplasma helicoides]
MKKLLYTLASLAFVSSPIVSVVACNKNAAPSDEGNKDNNDKPGTNTPGTNEPGTDLPDLSSPAADLADYNWNTKLSSEQNEMKAGAEVISRLILASRHENLNYNANEILSNYLAPYPTTLGLPTGYTYKNRQVNMGAAIDRYKSLLAPELIKNMNGEGYAGIYSSYIMGMYNDDFYKNLIKNGYFADSFNDKGGLEIIKVIKITPLEFLQDLIKT